MSSNNKHNKNLSREDILKYLTTRDEQEKRVIEGKALENDFDKEALDGWASNGAAISDLTNLDKKYRHSSFKTGIILSVIFIVCLGTGIFLFMKDNHQSSVSIVNVEKTDLILPDSVEQLIELPPSELISVNEIKKEIPVKTNKTIDKEPKQAIKEQITISELPVLKPEFPALKSTLKKAEAKEIYLHNLKLIDYRTYRKRPNLTIESLQLSGVPADREAKEQVIKENQLFDLEVAYYDYIDKTTDLLNKEDYKQALARLNIILSHYQDDLNALFYSGLCYYNLGEYNRSTEAFKRCLTSKFSNFDEEAEWMLAKSYEADGQAEKAKAIFKLIKERGGYYSGKL